MVYSIEYMCITIPKLLSLLYLSFSREIIGLNHVVYIFSNKVFHLFIYVNC